MKTAMKTSESPRSDSAERCIRFDSNVEEIQNEEGWVSDEEIAEAAAMIFDAQDLPLTPVDQKRVFIGELPFNSPSQEDLGLEKAGRESPSTISSTTLYSDTAIAPPPLSDNFSGEWLYTDESEISSGSSSSKDIISLDDCHYATIIQSCVRRMLAIKKFRKLRIKHLESQIAGLRWFAATKIQAFFRSWHCRMMCRIAILEKRLARSQRRKEYSLHWIEENKKHDMARHDRATIMVVQKNLARSERDLIQAQKSVEELRSENKKLRQQNHTLMEANDIQGDKEKELQKQFDAYGRYNEMLSSRTPQLEREHKAITDSMAIFERRIAQFQNALTQAKEYEAFETGVIDSTKAVILKTLRLLKDTSTDKEFALRIVEMGTHGLKKNELYAEHLRNMTKEKLQRLKEKKATEGESKVDHEDVPDEVELCSTDFDVSTSGSSSSGEEDVEESRSSKQTTEKNEKQTPIVLGDKKAEMTPVASPDSTESEAETSMASESSNKSVSSGTTSQRKKSKARKSTSASKKRSFKNTLEKVGSESADKLASTSTHSLAEKSLGGESSSRRSTKNVPERTGTVVVSPSKRTLMAKEALERPSESKSAEVQASTSKIANPKSSPNKRAYETRNRKANIQNDIKKAALRLSVAKLDNV